MSSSISANAIILYVFYKISLIKSKHILVNLPAKLIQEETRMGLKRISSAKKLLFSLGYFKEVRVVNYVGKSGVFVWDAKKYKYSGLKKYFKTKGFSFKKSKNGYIMSRLKD